MSSLPVQTDNSVQLSYSSFPFTITNVDNYASSNYVSNISNILKANIDTKQNLLTAATNLLGIGTAITAIDYNKISVNKPTNFQADWLTTIINKPTYFQTDWNSTISNKPTNFQADWLTTIINKPSTFPADMSIIYTKNEVNNISNVLQTNINTKENILTFSSPLTRTTNTIGINLASYSTTGNDANYLLKTGGDISGTLNFGSRVQNFLINLYATNEYGFGITGGALMYHCMGSHNFYTNQILKASISSSGTITATTFSGSGSSLTDIPYASITGKPTNFQADWLSTIINKPSTFPADMTNIYTKIETNNLLNAKEAVLTFSSPLTRTTNTIGINLASYSTTGNDANYLLKTGGTMSGQITGITTLTATTINSTILTTTNNTNVVAPTKGANGGTGDRLVLWPGNSIVYPYSLGIDNSTLWYSVPDTATHKFYINGSSITTISSTGLSTTGTINASTNLQENGTNLTSKYLQLGGGTMTGQLQISASTYNGLYMTNTNTADIVSIELRNNTTYSGFIGIGCTAYTGNYKNNLFIQSPQSLILNTNGNATSATPNFIINTSGNVGLATTNPTCRLSLGTPVGYKVLSLWDNATPNNFQFVGFGNNGGLCLNTNNNTTDAIQFRAGASATTANELMRINGNGSVCIGTASATSTNTKLTISGTSSGASQPIVRIEQLAAWDGGAKNYAFQVSGYSDLGGIRINGTDTFNTIFTTGNNDMGLSTNTGVMKFITNGNERMRIDSNGNLSLGTTDTASYKMRIRGTNPAYLRIETDFSDAGQVSGIQFGIPNFTNAGTAKITSTTYGNDVNDLRFSTSSGPNLSTIKMTINGNGNISCTNDFTAAGPITSTSTTPSSFSFINIYHAPLARTTHIPFSDNNIYLRAPVKIDFDNLSFGSRINDYLINLYATNEYGFGINNNTLRYNTMANHSFYCNGIMKANINSSGTIEATTLYGTTVFASGTSKASKFMVRLGEQTGYNYNWNGTGLSGWFIGLNQFWSANSDNDGTAYLTMTVCGSTNSQYCWFGRVYVKGGGGTWGIITDYKTPTSGVYELFVTEHFDGSGNNVLRFRTGTPGVLTENLRFKICG
jgi:hypothetical protein